MDINIADVMLPKYIPLIFDKSNYLNIIGSRGSGKSKGIAQIIILRMITHRFFRGVGVRFYDGDTANSIQTVLIDVVNEWGMQRFFHVIKKPFSITYMPNGNYFITKGLSTPKSYKSLAEFSFVFFEEELCLTKEDFMDISNSIRTTKADWTQIVHCLNPTLPGYYKDHWFYNYFGYSETNRMEFKKVVSGEIEIDGQVTKTSYTINNVHCTYKDNKYLKASKVLELESETDPYLYQTNTLGIWASREVGDKFFTGFDHSKHLDKVKYDPELPLHMSFDFNHRPYSAVIVSQVIDKKIYIIDEICIQSRLVKASSIDQSCNEIKQRYKNHKGYIYVYGDPSGYAQKADKEQGANSFSQIADNLAEFTLEFRVMTKAPSVSDSRVFVNKLFCGQINDWRLVISDNCRELINDLMFLQVDDEGGKKIEYMKDPIDKTKQYEKYGHTSDCLRYYVTSLLRAEWGASLTPKGLYSDKQISVAQSKYRVM